MVHGITGHNFETRHPRDDSDQVWNEKQKGLTFWKFDEKKGNYSKMGTQIYLKIAG